MSHTEKPSTTNTAMDDVVPLQQSFAAPTTPAAKTDDTAVRAAQQAQTEELLRTKGATYVYGMCG